MSSVNFEGRVPRTCQIVSLYKKADSETFCEHFFHECACRLVGKNGRSYDMYVDLVESSNAFWKCHSMWVNHKRLLRSPHNHVPFSFLVFPIVFTMSCINDQQVSVEPNTAPKITPQSLPISPKASDFLYGSKGFMSRTTPDVLTKMMRPSASFSVRSAFLQDYERRRKSDSAVSFETVEKKDPETIDYGYGEDFVPPPPKRRRMERRNSKTPRMLMAMNASLSGLDFLNDTDDIFKIQPTGNEEFDSGLQIAEDLVKHLNTRRRRTALSTSSSSCL